MINNTVDGQILSGVGEVEGLAPLTCRC